MGITFTEALNNELLCDEIIKILPKKCKCGSDVEFSDSLTNIYCTNENCSEVLIFRLLNFCKKNNIEIKYSEAKTLVDKFRIVTPYQILLLDSSNSVSKNIKNILHDSDLFIQKIKEVKSKEYTLGNIANMCGIQTIELIADKIFDGFYSFDDAFNKIEQSQLIFVGERLGTKNINSSSFSLLIYSELLRLKEEFLLAETQLKVKQPNKSILYIAIDGNNLDNFCNKSEVIEYMNRNSNYKCVLTHIVDNNTDILISGLSISTNKYKIAKMINDKYIADEMNNGNLTLNDIGKILDNQIKPLGYKVYIDNLDNVINRVCGKRGI